MNKFIQALDKLLSLVCVTLMTLLVACVVWQVFSRYVLGAPSTVTDELARFLFIWVGLLGAAYTLGKKKHLAMDFMLFALKGKKRHTLQVFIALVGVVFAGLLMIYGGGSLVLKTLSLGQTSPVLGLQMGWVYSAIPLSGVCMLFYLVRDLYSTDQE